MKESDRDRTFLIPRRVKTDVTLLGMTRRHLLLVLPWWFAALVVYFAGGSLPPAWHLMIPAALGLLGFVLFGWRGGEDDRTAWELLHRWWHHTRLPHRYTYRKEREG